MPQSKFVPIVEQLKAELARLEPGARFVSENEVATRFRVSRPTAGRALRELSEAGLIERRVGAGTFVRDGGRREGRSIGLLLAGLGATEVWDPLTRHISHACALQGLSVVVDPLGGPRDEVGSTSEQVEWLLDQGVDGVLFAPLEHVAGREDANRAICRRLTEAGIQVVLLDRDLVEFPGRSEFDLVGMDNFRGGAELGAHLAATGRTRALFLSYPDFPSTTDLRAAGCRWGLATAGVVPRADWHAQGDPSDGAWVQAVLAEHQPEVVVCSNDRTAALLMQTLVKIGRPVPSEIAVTGFDDVVYSQLLPVGLTTVAQPFEAIARAAVRRLAERIADPGLDTVEILLPPSLVVRASTGAPSGS